MTNSAFVCYLSLLPDPTSLNDTQVIIPKASHAAAVMNQVHNSVTVKKPQSGMRRRVRVLKPLVKLTSDILSSQNETTSVDQSDSGIVERMPHKLDKNTVLEEYNAKYATPLSGPVVPMSKQGKRIKSYSTTLPNHHQLVKHCTMRPSFSKQYRIEDLKLCDVAVPVVKFCIEWGEQAILQGISLVNKKYNMMVKEVTRLSKVDFTPLLLPLENYESQTSIQAERVDMATALLVYYNMQPGMALRFLQGEYTGETRDVEKVCRTLAPHIDADDLNQIRRILTEGCPAELDFEEKSDNKQRMLERGNQSSYDQYPDIVQKTMNKEDRYSHIVTLSQWTVFFSPYLRHTPQGMRVVPNKNPRLVWDGSTMMLPDDVVLNDVTPTELEASISFGDTLSKLLRHVYNIRASFPNLDILLAMADIKACYRFPRINVDLAGAFGFLSIDYYHLANSMVFGSSVSAPSWEAFRRAIEVMSQVNYNQEGLVEKHKEYLSKIKWDIETFNPSDLTQAKKCNINQGIVTNTQDASDPPVPVFIYVDDALLAAMGRESMEKALAATIESIFTVMGEPDLSRRQCHLAMDKWLELVVAARQIMLGLEINTRSLTLGITIEYRTDLLQLLNEEWKYNKQTFKANEMQKLLGKLARLGQGAPWVYKLMSHLYSSTAFALQQNKIFLQSSSTEFKNIVNEIKSKQYRQKTSELAKEINFALKRAAKMIHQCKKEFNINASMREEIEWFRQVLDPNNDFKFETPIAHLIKKTPLGQMLGDSSLRACGGFGLVLEVWWHLPFPDSIIEQTLLYLKNNKDEKFVSINCLEFITVIINYCAALTAMNQKAYTDDPHPVILMVTDNKSALNWTLHTSKRSIIGRALARFFCGLMIESPLGINSEWISTEENNIADDISRLKKQKPLATSPFPDTDSSFDYSSIKQKYSALRACRFYHPSPELLSTLWTICLTKKCPSLKEIADMKRRGLGWLSTSSGQN